jgi:spermidine synthase
MGEVPMRKLAKYLPHVVVFLSSMGVMIIELVASRLISKYFGNSLFTWTGVIGVILAGISAGNYIGGRLADKYSPAKIISPILFLASALVFSILALDALLGFFMGGVGATGITALLILRSILGISFLFLLPAAALGMISPVMAKYALEFGGLVGTTVGTIYAMSTIGSIVGTFLAGFVLIPSLGVRTIVFVVALTLALLGLLVKGRALIFGLWAALIAAGLFLSTGPFSGAATLPPEERKDGVLYTTDSLYSHIEVKNTEQGKKRILIMDGLIHNMHDLENPDNLLYEYERIFLAVTRVFERDLAKRSDFSTLTLGGGAMTFPAYLDKHLEAGRHEVVEIDPRVVETAHRYFDVPRDAKLKIHVMDARQFVQMNRAGPAKWDIIYLDAFNSFSIPYHLTTKEFTAGVRELLAEGGIVLANTIDIVKYGGFLNAYYNTLKAVFPHVEVYGSPNFSRELRSTFVIAASMFPLDRDVLVDPNGTVIAKKVDDTVLADLRRRNGEKPLTDDHAPVENIMIPVFLNTISK